MKFTKHSSAKERNKQTSTFWDIGGYSPTTRRISNGIKSMDELRIYLGERAQLAENYAKELSDLSNKWAVRLSKSEEYGAAKELWGELLDEPAKTSSLQVQLAMELSCRQAEVKKWTTGQTKELFRNKSVKDHESRFRIAQKEWAVRLVHMRKARTDYNSFSARLHDCELRKNISALDQGEAQESLKQKDRTLRLRKQQEDSRTAYIEAIRLVNERRDCYSHEMMRIFESCQLVEKQRIEYFSVLSLQLADIMTKYNQTELCPIYGRIRDNLESIDPQSSLNYWHDMNGPACPLPVYEYEESHIQEQVDMLANKVLRQSAETSSFKKMSMEAKMSLMETNGGTSEQSSVFQQAVVAIYDYDGAEGDELSFRAGQRLIRFSQEDENGWVKCMDDGGKYGFVPSKFIRDNSL